MGAEANGLSLESLAQRLEALERENERMRSENAELRSKVATLEGPDTHRGEGAELSGLSTRWDRAIALRDSGTRQAADSAAAESKPFGSEERVSRGWLLSKAGAAAVGTVAAGALLLGNAREAAAAIVRGTTNTAKRGAVEGVNQHRDGYGVWGNNPNGLGVYGTSRATTGVFGETTQGIGIIGLSREQTFGVGVSGAGEQAGVHGNGNKGVFGVGQTGVWGTSETGTGVRGESSTVGHAAVVGKHTKAGFQAIGVLGDTVDGVGVKGIGKNGVIGEAPNLGHAAVYGKHTGSAGYGIVGDGTGNGAGVLGRNREGYGGQFEGGTAQLRLVPGSSLGSPTTGAHIKGELYMDSGATLWVCVADGSPGAWEQISIVG